MDYAGRALESHFMFVCLFDFGPRLLQLFRRILQDNFAVKLQKCLVKYKTLTDSVDFPPNADDKVMTEFSFLDALFLYFLHQFKE